MRIQCLPCKTDFRWLNMSAAEPGSLWFLACPTCMTLAIPPGPAVLDPQGILDLLLAMISTGGGYYDKTKMRVLLS